MPAKKISSRIPKAPRAKRIMHTFYLLQPILQFLVLVFMIGILTRCSPLASSSDRAGNKVSNPELTLNPNQNGQELAEEELIRSNLKELSNQNVEVIKESLFNREAKNSLRKDERSDETKVRNIWRSRDTENPLRRGKILTIALSNEQKEKLWSEGSIQIELADYTHNFLDERGHKLFLKELKKNHDNLDINASTYIVIPDASFQSEFSEIELKIKVSLSVPSLEKAVLIVKRDERNDSEALLEAALHEAKITAIVLE